MTATATKKFSDLQLTMARVMKMPVTERTTAMPVWASTSCPHRKCKFCLFTQGKMRNVQFGVRPIDEVRATMRQTRDFYSRLWFNGIHHGKVERIFILDEDSMAMPPHRVLQLLAVAKEELPDLKEASMYARVKSILARREALEKLRLAGLTEVYVGLESGLEALLTENCKGVTVAENIAAGRLLAKAGITQWAMIILGLAGQDRSKEHALATAEMFNRMGTANTNVLFTTFTPSIEYESLAQHGRFKPASEEQMILEALTVLRALNYGNGKYVIATNVACCGDHHLEVGVQNMVRELEVVLRLITQGKTHLAYVYADGICRG